MKLHWSPKSPYVRKVMVAAHELGCVGDITLVRTVAAMREPNEALMRDNPLSKIPAMVLEDGSPLFDSIVICEYLNDRYTGELFPRQGSAKWQALRWNALADGLLDALILWRNERERTPSQQSQPLMAAFEVKVRACLGVLDAQAAELGQAGFAIGHIAVACALGYLDFRFDSLGWRGIAPQLAGWEAAAVRRPSMVATQPSFDS